MPLSKQPLAYVYPNIPREMMGSKNPYIEDLKHSLSKNGLKIDLSTSTSAFPDLVRKGWRADMVILNWVENMPSLKLGYLQTAAFLFYLTLLKLLRVRIIWIKHNKISHNKDRFVIKKLLQDILLRYSDHIITHSIDPQLKDRANVSYIPHPNKINPDTLLEPSKNEVPAIDFLIWGSILPYKGILEFLRFLDKSQPPVPYNVHIAGRCSDPAYWNEISGLGKRSVTIQDQYIEEEELRKLFHRSRFILFTYKNDSVMSSGVLIDSLIACKRIIAPRFGAFADLADSNGFVSTYDHFSDIADLYKSEYQHYLLDPSDIKEFLSENDWDSFAKTLQHLYTK